ncbi:ParB/RepB/Spo0J family partition protein [Umezawaea tangerina]|uniref:ParB-like chromosome segregation protein Spo0J n=1 Tax=Umezawaea tangerina TaxID=84725 RepID=A0A2T0SG81_9PSEU|nr:ParB N-terminal domain-containing protein [Umezawaea tangerina]PRY32428.1 ParB-like chromosome segregation protein Spo0J [Umezawaea tangerina]
MNSTRGGGPPVREVVARVAVTALRPSDTPRLTGTKDEHVDVLVGSGAELPPILVHRATMRVVDGMHRLRAAQRRGEDMIDVRYVDGSEDDLFVIAVRENIAHGLPLTLADRRAAAERILMTRPTWSDRAIAASAGLSPKTVGALRRRRSDELGDAQARLGIDGRLRRVKSGAADPSANGRPAERADVPTRRRAEPRTDPSPGPRQPEHVRGEAAREHVRGEAARAGGHPHAVAPSEAGAAEILRVLRGDPSLRFTESGRTLIRAFEAQLTWASNAEDLVANLPAHCLKMVQDMAWTCAGTWRGFAEGVRTRERGLSAEGDDVIGHSARRLAN